jgi:hypothetical protein
MIEQKQMIVLAWSEKHFWNSDWQARACVFSRDLSEWDRAKEYQSKLPYPVSAIFTLPDTDRALAMARNRILTITGIRVRNTRTRSAIRAIRLCGRESGLMAELRDALNGRMRSRLFRSGFDA